MLTRWQPASCALSLARNKRGKQHSSIVAFEDCSGDVDIDIGAGAGKDGGDRSSGSYMDEVMSPLKDYA